MIVQKAVFEGKVMAYIKSNNITNPYCYGIYQANISRTLLGIEIDVGVDVNNRYIDCSVTPDHYNRCSAFDYTNALHPCSYVRSYFRTFGTN